MVGYVLGWIFVGLIAGSLAQSATGLKKRGCLFTLLIGALGGVVGGALFNAIGSRRLKDSGIGSILVAFVGAGVVCFALRLLERRR